MAEKLKTCPFSGGEIIIEQCIVPVHDYFFTCLACGIESSIYDDEESATKACNRRT